MNKPMLPTKILETISEIPDVDNKQVLHNSKQLLQIYRSVVWRIEKQVTEFDSDCYFAAGKHLHNLVSAFFDPDTMSELNFEDRLRNIYVSQSMIELVDRSLIMLRDYPEYGEDYYKIIYNQYIVKGKALKEKDMLELMGMEKSTFYRKKREALFQFGTVLWGYMVPLLLDSLKKISFNPKNHDT